MTKKEKTRMFFELAYQQFKHAHEYADPFKHEAGLRNSAYSRKLEDEFVDNSTLTI